MKKSIVNDIGLYKTRLLSMLTEDSDICGLLLNKEDFTEAEANGLPVQSDFPLSLYKYTGRNQNLPLFRS